jgi:hypothetical protein
VLSSISSSVDDNHSTACLVMVIGEKSHGAEGDKFNAFQAAKPGDVIGHRIAPYSALHNEELTNSFYSNHVDGDPGTP